MGTTSTISLILNGHIPFIKEEADPQAPQKYWLYNLLYETLIPLLQTFDRLEGDRIPFKLGIVFSPLLIQQLQDPALIESFIQFLDAKIELGEREVNRTRDIPWMNHLAHTYYDRAIEYRVLFTERYEKNVIRAFDIYQKKGKVEILATAATYAFLPFYTSYPEAIKAQIEVALKTYREAFGRFPEGFWLPEAGWNPELDEILRSYGFSYTVVDTHGLLQGHPIPQEGTFQPVRTPAGLKVLARNLALSRAVWDAHEGYPTHACYREYYWDIGYELPREDMKAFVASDGSRQQTGYKYWAVTGGEGEKQPYIPQDAHGQIQKDVEAFVELCEGHLDTYRRLREKEGCLVGAYNLDLFGHRWYEGIDFLETFFRKAAQRSSFAVDTPAHVCAHFSQEKLEEVMPEFSSWGENGFGETWLNSSNDWMYPPVLKITEKMIELAERFPNDGGLKERTLNQAAREVLLAQASDWASMLHYQQAVEYARHMVESCVGNFSIIYESLGGNYISTEWLTQLEKRHAIFPDINYRIFRKKR
ncbi:MAG: 1,4-alpha-glucan branching protein domain-containing protein [Breznakiellaceae bacterium]